MIDLDICNPNDILISQKGEVFLYLRYKNNVHIIKIIENRFGDRDIKNYDVYRAYLKNGYRLYSSNMMHNIIEIILN